MDDLFTPRHVRSEESIGNVGNVGNVGNKGNKGNKSSSSDDITYDTDNKQQSVHGKNPSQVSSSLPGSIIERIKKATDLSASSCSSVDTIDTNASSVVPPSTSSEGQ